MYETQSSVAVAYFLPDRAKDLSAPLYSLYRMFDQPTRGCLPSCELGDSWQPLNVNTSILSSRYGD